MLERLTKQGHAEEYWRLGGRLNRDSFKEVGAILLELANGKKPGVRDSLLAQAENMAEFSRVPITEEQKYLYSILREIIRKTERKFDSSPEIPGVMQPWNLTDQRLFAEVLLLTGAMTEYYSFMRAYPNIFGRVVKPQK